MATVCYYCCEDLALLYLARISSDRTVVYGSDGLMLVSALVSLVAKALPVGRWLQNLAGMPWSSKVLVRGDTLLARVAKGQSQLCWRFAGKLMFYSHVRPQPGES